MNQLAVLFTIFISLFVTPSFADENNLREQLERIKQKYQAFDQQKAALNQGSLPRLDVNSIGIPNGEELVLSTYVDSIFIGDVFAEKSSSNAKLGLNALITLLDFPIFFSNDLTTAEGWYFNENNTFSLTTHGADLQIKMSDNSFFLSKGSYTIREDDIYLESDIIEQWFGFTFAYDFRRLQVKLTSQNLLPIQLQLARREKKALEETSSREATLPLKNNPYKLFTPPVADLQISVNKREHRNSTSSYSLLGSNDLAYFNAQYSLSGTNQDNLTDFRLNLSKESSEANLLGPLNATSLQIGDVQATSIGLNSSTKLSRGIHITNRPLTNRSNQSRININGDIQPGWDIELYRNGILIGNQFSIDDNRYEFKDVDLLYGNNLFEIVFYGPQGQTLKETRQYFISNNDFDNQGNYHLSLVDRGESLFGVENSTIKNQEPGIELAGTYTKGLTNWLSAYIGGSTLLDDHGSADNPKNRYSTGVDVSVFNRVLLGIDFIESSNNESTVEYTGRTVLGDQSINLSAKKDKVINTSSLNLEQNDSYKLSVAGRLFSKTPVSYQQSFEQFISHNGSTTNSITNDLGFNINDSSINHSLQWQETNSTASTQSQLTGEIRTRQIFGPIFLRNQLDYSIKPKSSIDQLKTEANLNTSEDIDLKFSYSRLFDNNVNEYGAGITWKPDEMILSSNFLYNDTSGWNVNLIGRLSVGQKATETSNVFFITQKSLVNRGSILVRVFEDTNTNAVYDIGEPLLSGIKVKSLQNHNSAITDNSGIAVLTSMQNNRATDIIVDTGTLPDAYLQPLTPGISISPRRGYVDNYDFPITQVSEIEGTVFIGQLDSDKYAFYATLNLVNQNNEIVATTQSEYDGYYLFENIFPGNYRVDIDRNYTEKRNLIHPAPKNVAITSTSEIISNFDFVLQEPRNLNGYVTQIGTFNSLETLNAFWLILNQTHPSFNTHKTAYYNQTDNKLSLFSAFFSEREKAEEECKRLIENNIQCVVNEKSLN
ncbi:hypothetical protein [Marinomonas sp. 2405UD68-3]|uniref:hypothetical protein n=1 Tax=Marinomonas sp. 2405UD68-3 TaxID=3391835 RepID=UPI0039C9932E